MWLCTYTLCIFKILYKAKSEVILCSADGLWYIIFEKWSITIPNVLVEKKVQFFIKCFLNFSDFTVAFYFTFCYDSCVQIHLIYCFYLLIYEHLIISSIMNTA